MISDRLYSLIFIFSLHPFASELNYIRLHNQLQLSKFSMTWFLDAFIDQWLQNCWTCTLLRHKFFLMKAVTVKLFQVTFILLVHHHHYPLTNCLPFTPFIIHFVHSVQSILFCSRQKRRLSWLFSFIHDDVEKV